MLNNIISLIDIDIDQQALFSIQYGYTVTIEYSTPLPHPTPTPPPKLSKENYLVLSPENGKNGKRKSREQECDGEKWVKKGGNMNKRVITTERGAIAYIQQ